MLGASEDRPDGGQGHAKAGPAILESICVGDSIGSGTAGQSPLVGPHELEGPSPKTGWQESPSHSMCLGRPPGETC